MENDYQEGGSKRYITNVIARNLDNGNKAVFALSELIRRNAVCNILNQNEHATI